MHPEQLGGLRDITAAVGQNPLPVLPLDAGLGNLADEHRDHQRCGGKHNLHSSQVDREPLGGVMTFKYGHTHMHREQESEASHG